MQFAAVQAFRPAAGDQFGQCRHVEQRDPSSLSFTQAARLVGMGASVDDLTQSCGLSKAEAELISRLHTPKAGQSQ